MSSDEAEDIANVLPDQETLDIFKEEAADILLEWEKQCLGLKQTKDPELIEALFRSAHNLKGATSALGFQRLSTFIHKIEDVIERLRNQSLSPDQDTIVILLEAQSLLSLWIQSIEDGPKTCPDTQLFTHLQTELDTRLMQEAAPETTPNNLLSRQADSSSLAQQPDIKQGIDQGTKPETNAQPEGHGSSAPSTLKSSPTHSMVRISLQKIDELMELIGELSTHQAILEDMHQNKMYQSKLYANALTMSRKIVSDLGRKGLALRLVPLATLFQRLERLAQDIASKQKKPLNVLTEGMHVELDRTLIERILEPVTHIIRNAIDHGIEPAPERLAKGKPETAQLTITASQTPKGVKIVIADDGRGIDPNRIRDKAKAKGLIAEQEHLTDREALRMILQPGFSTAEQVTDLSGRGVGLDVVKRVLDSVNGQVEILSTIGQGTNMELNLPTSMNIINALIIDVAGLHYAVPTGELAEVINLDGTGVIEHIEMGLSLTLRGTSMPMTALAEFLPLGERSDSLPLQQTRAKKHSGPALIYREADTRVAFCVDRVISQRPIFMKSVLNDLEQIPVFSGTTVLADGEPGMVINMHAIAQAFIKAKRASHATNNVLAPPLQPAN